MLRYTLVGDGSSDRVLIRVIDWAILSRIDKPVQGRQAINLPPLKKGLKARLQAACALYPCDMLFVHRDAESEESDVRHTEIMEAADGVHTAFVPIVPVRMTEAWLLGNEDALRSAAENRQGRVPLNLPDLKRCEALVDAKSILHEALRTASELPKRRLDKKPIGRWVERVADFTDDWSHLRALKSFRDFDNAVEIALRGLAL